MTTREEISDFLARKRVAMVGVSRNPKDFTRMLFREFRQRGYDVVPVNPGAAEVDGLKSHARVQDIEPAVDAAVVLTPASASEQAVSDCAEAGIGSVWLYRGVTAGAVSDAALRLCESKGIRVVAGACPFMFLPRTGLPHRIHGFCRKLTGRHPR